MARLAMSRRRFLGRAGTLLAGAAVAPAVLAACGSSGSVRWWRWREVRHDLELARVHRQAVEEGLHEGHGDRAHVPRGHQRQQRVLRQDPPEPCREDQSIGTDGFVLTDWMANRVINQVKWTQPLVAKQFPNKANLREAARAPGLRPDPRVRRRRGPSGVAGVAYNLDEHRREGDQDARRLPRGRRAPRRCSREMRDTVGLFMLADGKDITKPDLRRGRAGVRPAQQGVLRRQRSTAPTATST